MDLRTDLFIRNISEFEDETIETIQTKAQKEEKPRKKLRVLQTCV